jgi:predicted nucleotidyltransferase
MYGLNISTSDDDVCGIFKIPMDERLVVDGECMQYCENKDTTYYEVKKYIKLASENNPNLLELLFVPEDCWLKCTSEYDLLIKNKHLFVSKKAKFSFQGYAFSQIQRAKGQNKKINHFDKYVNSNGIEKLQVMLLSKEITPEWVIMKFNKNFYNYVIKDMTIDNSSKTDWNKCDKLLQDPDISQMLKPVRKDYFQVFYGLYEPEWKNAVKEAVMPFRPVKVDIDKYMWDASAVEHVHNLYRVYSNGSGISFDNDSVKMTSIPIEREWKDFVGILHFNENGYKKDCSEWESFFEWIANRNAHRWTTQENKELDFDPKSMAHNCRLLLSARNIAINHEPIVRFTGHMKDFLLDVRNGKYTYDWLVKYSEDCMKELDELFEHSSLQHHVDMDKINTLYKELIS